MLEVWLPVKLNGNRFLKADLHRSPNMYNLNDKKNACKKQWYSHDFHLYLFHYIEFETNHQSLSCIYTPVSSGTMYI